MKKKSSPLKKARDKAWKWFSIWIRIKYADSDGNTTCVTCGDTRHWRNQQAGHFIDGRTNALLFDEDLVFPQCYRCNVPLRGNKVEYTLFMLRMGYTPDDIEELRERKHRKVIYKTCDYSELADKFKEQAEQIAVEKGLNIT